MFYGVFNFLIDGGYYYRMALFIKAMIGALMVVAISLLSKSKNYFIAGLVPLFPTFALIAHYIVGSTRSVSNLKMTLLFGMWSLIPYFLYLFSLYFYVDRMKLVWALSSATLTWALAAGVLILAWSRWHG